MSHFNETAPLFGLFRAALSLFSINILYKRRPFRSAFGTEGPLCSLPFFLFNFPLPAVEGPVLRSRGADTELGVELRQRPVPAGEHA